MSKPEFCRNCEHLLHIEWREWRCKKWEIMGPFKFKQLPAARIVVETTSDYAPTRHWQCRESGKWFKEAVK